MSLGIAEDLSSILSKFKFWTTINEYENGLFLNGGKIETRKISDKKLDYLLECEWEKLQEESKVDEIKIQEDHPRNLSHLIEIEKKVYKEFFNAKGQKKFDPNFNEKYANWHVSKKGMPLHPTRFRKNLPYGIYFHVPTLLGIQQVDSMSIAEVVKDLRFVSILANGQSVGGVLEVSDETNKSNPKQYVSAEIEQSVKNASIKAKDLHSVILGGMLRYRIEDAYKTYTNVADWESSYQSQAMMVISNYCRGKYLTDFYSKSFIDGLHVHLKKDLNEMPREKWGIKTEQVSMFTVSTHTLNRNIQELSSDGFYVNLATVPENKNQ